jgi:uncharacterized membrane protein YsdA (DUF1294 family)
VEHYPLTEFVIFKVFAGLGCVIALLSFLLSVVFGWIGVFVGKNDDEKGQGCGMLVFSLVALMIGSWLGESCYNYKSRIHFKIPHISVKLDNGKTIHSRSEHR